MGVCASESNPLLVIRSVYGIQHSQQRGETYRNHDPQSHHPLLHGCQKPSDFRRCDLTLQVVSHHCSIGLILGWTNIRNTPGWWPTSTQWPIQQ